MIDKYRDKLDEKGVSPVIGVILLVAVTVALVALATVIVFDIGSDVSDTADASVQMEQTDSGVQATIVRNENVDEFILRHEDGTEQRSTKSIGSFTYDNGDGEYTLIGVVGGNEEVIRSTTVVGAESGETLSGTAEINPLIVGATVEAYDAGGTLVDSTTTDANGQYELTVADASSARIVLNTEGDINYNGEPLHASAEQSGFSAGDTVNFNFDETTVISGVSVNGTLVTVVSALEGESSSVIDVGNLAQLQAMQEDLDADYKLIRDIDASGTVNWNNGQGFKSIGDYEVRFTGSLDGKKYDISGLNIKRQSENYVGLFGAIGAGGEVKNVGVINVNMTGNYVVGSLAGINSGTVSNSYSTGNVSGELYYVGGLVGENDSGNISNSYSTGNVTAVSNSGGLVGENNNGNISNSYSTGNVTGGLDNVGGLVGYNFYGNISNSYSTGNVTGEDYVGGLVGENYGTVSNSYSTGNVSGESVGGLLGHINSDGSVSDSYWDINSTGQSSSAGLPDSNGLTTSEMQGSSAEGNMNTFDFTSTWSTVEGDYPELQE